MGKKSEVKNVHPGAKKITEISTLFENQLLTYTQAAEFLCITPQYLRELKAKGAIKAVEIGPNCVRFRVASLNQFILEREVS
jgi:excisionase family DNA binding protein